ncbi:MAG: nicotinate phosphoribosyltransferase [Candidatus Paceibacterota bacterium]
MNRQKDKPIITSLLDSDFYKYTMGQESFHRHPTAQVTFSLTNRTRSVRLADCVDIGRLREELDEVRKLAFTISNIHYLRGTDEYGQRMFREDYLEHLKALRLGAYDLDVVDGQFHLEFSGPWSVVTYWETLALSILTELYTEYQLSKMSRLEQDAVLARGYTQLLEKVRILKSFPDITLTDFSSRRRAFREWQDYVVSVLIEELPGQFRGTSNVLLSDKYGTVPMGTAAHERDMIIAGIMSDTDEGILRTIQMTLESWWEEYGEALSVALPDTFGTDAFFRAMTAEQAAKWKGLRQDSGNPFTFVDKVIAFYKSHGIDPQKKLIVFSDGLEIDKILAIADYCRGKIRATFGWGTNLGNDLGLQALSLVIKATRANGKPLVKLSDNLAKAIGPKDEIDRYKRIFGYDVILNEQPKY